MLLIVPPLLRWSVFLLEEIPFLNSEMITYMYWLFIQSGLPGGMVGFDYNYHLLLSKAKFQTQVFAVDELFSAFFFSVTLVASDYWKSVWWHTEHHWDHQAPLVNFDLWTDAWECETLLLLNLVLVQDVPKQSGWALSRLLVDVDDGDRGEV